MVKGSGHSVVMSGHVRIFMLTGIEATAIQVMKSAKDIHTNVCSTDKPDEKQDVVSRSSCTVEKISCTMNEIEIFWVNYTPKVLVRLITLEMNVFDMLAMGPMDGS